MADHVKLHIRKRVLILFLIVVFLMFGLFLRLVWVQVVTSADYQNLAMQQRLRELKVAPERGLIVDRNGEELVVSGAAETVVALPPEIKNPEQTAKLLAPLSGFSYAEIYRRITAERWSMYLDRQIGPEVAQKFKALDLPGIITVPEARRYYPKGELAAHILGFAGTDNDGLEGLEHTMDNYLRGIPGQMAVEKDARGRELPNGVQKYYPPQDGYNVFLTIDHVIQYIAERELERGLTKVKADGGTVIVMNPRTGEILALANKPSYNPNVFSRYVDNWRNIAVSDTFEPGSTFKIVTAAAALEEGVVNVNDKFFCNGSITVADARIGCWEEQGHGSQTFAQVVENSCNPGFVQVGQRLGAESFYKYIEAFGFGKKTGIQLSGEEKGILYALPDIGPVELATMSFGHSISVTPIQLITAVSAVANDGLLLRPQLVSKIQDKDGNIIKQFEPEPIRQVVSKETAQLTRRLLGNVVEEGTGKNAQVEGYEIGGKTGTAQDYKNKAAYDASFIGLVPVDEPELVILVVLYNVTSYPHFGSQTAAPIFQKIAKDTLRHLQIPPQNLPTETKTRTEPVKITVPNLRNLSVDEARAKLTKTGFGFKVEGSGEQVIEQVPLPGAVMSDHSTVILFTEDGLDEKKRYQVTVPNLKGMQVKDAVNLLAELGLKSSSSKSQGKIINQIPVAYTRVDSGTVVKVFTE